MENDGECRNASLTVLHLKMLATITGRTIQEEARNPTIKRSDKRRGTEDGAGWGHVLRMPEHRLVRQVLLNCVKPSHETLFADVPNLSIENATKNVQG